MAHSARFDGRGEARGRAVVGVMVAVGLGLLAACSSADGSADLSPREVQGRDLVAERGCQSCHGVGGRGDIAPAFTGLFGSDVELADGRTVVADRAYLTRAILDPAADIVLGYTLRMPAVDLTDAEVGAIVDYVEGL